MLRKYCKWKYQLLIPKFHLSSQFLHACPALIKTLTITFFSLLYFSHFVTWINIDIRDLARVSYRERIITPLYLSYRTHLKSSSEPQNIFIISLHNSRFLHTRDCTSKIDRGEQIKQGEQYALGWRNYLFLCQRKKGLQDISFLLLSIYLKYKIYGDPFWDGAYLGSAVKGRLYQTSDLGIDSFSRRKKKKIITEKEKKSLAAIEKMLKRKMLYTPLCCPWCGHLRRCMEQDWKYLVLHLSIHKAECSGPLYLSSQTQKLAAKMGVALLSTEPLRRAEWWQQVQAPFPPSALPTGGLPHFLSSSW